ncbi:MAG: hypothetical protein JXR03_21460 [Cyclobacteriaceae bacterium]
MRKIITIALFTISISIQAQEEILIFDEFNSSQNFDWRGYVDFGQHTERANEFIGSLSKTGIEVTIPFELKKDNRELINKLKFVDLDADGVSEVVYSGPSGGEPNIVEIFQLKKQQYERVFSVMQGIVKPYWTDGKLTKLLTHDWGCCAENRIINSVYEVNFDNAITPEFSKTLDIVENQGLTKPKQFLESALTFEVKNDNYKLRLSPNIDGSTYFGYLTEHEQLGNSLGTVNKGTQGIAYAYSIDVTGRTWWYVAISTEYKLNESVLYMEDLHDNAFYVGWMSSRFLTKLDE